MGRSNGIKILTVLRKEITAGLRHRAALASMLMFALTALACMSLALGGAALEPKILAALLWIVIFFASTVGLDRSFEDEAAAGTLATLKVYADAQSILFGKMIYSLLSLTALTIFLLPMFIILFDCPIAAPLSMLLTVALGLVGLSGAGTLIAAIAATASVKSGLFSILLFPIVLPIFLPAIALTSAAMLGGEISLTMPIAMLLYDAILIVASSILFDYIWN